MPEHRVRVLDLDGVVNWRIPMQRAGLPLLGNPRVQERYSSPVAKKPVRSEEVDYAKTVKTIYDGIRHGLAPVFPDVARLIRQSENTTFYGSTGRHNNEPMIAATMFSFTWARNIK